MGLLLTFMFVWNMLGALILIPALSYFLLPDKRPGKVTDKPVETASTSAASKVHPQIHPRVEACAEGSLLKNQR
ncbi:hypothetical protein D3C78_1818740 [compost metagenome]